MKSKHRGLAAAVSNQQTRTRTCSLGRIITVTGMVALVGILQAAQAKPLASSANVQGGAILDLIGVTEPLENVQGGAILDLIGVTEAKRTIGDITGADTLKLGSGREHGLQSYVDYVEWARKVQVDFNTF